MSNRIQALRARIRQLNLRQDHLAEIAALDPATVSNALSGNTNPLNSTVEKLEGAVASEEQRLRDALGIPVGETADAP